MLAQPPTKPVFNCLVIIGRFQPFHLGHWQMLQLALEQSELVLIVCGSAYQPRSKRNPWTLAEREQMIRESLTDDEIVDRIAHWAFNRDNLLQAIPLVKERLDVFSDLAPKLSFLVEGMPEITPEAFASKKLEDDQVRKILQFAVWQTEGLRQWNRENLHDIFVAIAEKLDLKIRDVLAPIFVAISGKPVSPPLFDSMALLGPDMTRARLRHALDTVGGVSKKQAKKLEKEYRGLFG